MSHVSEGTPIHHDDGQLAIVNQGPSSIPLKHISSVPPSSDPKIHPHLITYSLATLAIQNSVLTLIMHHSRVSTPPSHVYSAATAVLLNEIFKGLISLIIAFTRIDTPLPEATQISHPLWTPPILTSSIFRLHRLGRDIFSSDCWKLSIPAILYVIQNNLQYVAVSNLDAATFQVTYQMKILTTAGFSVLLLRRKLALSQWLALLFLAAGVGIVQIQPRETGALPTSVAVSVHDMNRFKGFMAVTAACFTSGLAGVYFEMVLKNSQTDLWIRNVQLSLFSLLPALAPIVFSHASQAGLHMGGWSSTLFHNFGAWAWGTVFVQVLGGLVTAMVIKYSDNILKGFATSLSIVMSFLASIVLFDFKITLTFILGSVIVLIATWLYNQPPKRSCLPDAESIIWNLTHSEKRRGFASFNSQRSPIPISLNPSRRASSTSSPASIPFIITIPSFPDPSTEKSYIR